MCPGAGYFKFLCQMIIDLMIISDALASSFYSNAHIHNAQRGGTFVLFLSVFPLPTTEGNWMGWTMKRERF